MTSTRPSNNRLDDNTPLTMKKGKPNVPVNMRGDYRRQKELSQMREQMVAASRPGADGMPVFNLFVRTKKANVRIESGETALANKMLKFFGSLMLPFF